jgi:hypothetical protein
MEVRAARRSSSSGQSACTSKEVRNSATLRFTSESFTSRRIAASSSLDHFDVSPEVGTLLGEVRVDVEHTAVVIAHDAKTVVLHRMGYASSFDPFTNLDPGDWVIFQHARDLEEGDTTAIENVRNLRHWASLAVSEPLTRHFCAVAKTIESFVVDSRAKGSR